MEKTFRAHPEFVTDAMLGEGPCWDEISQKLWWVDILSGKLHQYNPSTKQNFTYHVGGHPGAAVLRQGGGLLLALQSGFAFFDAETGKLNKISDPESHLPENRFNDGKCDPAGRFWAGTMNYDIKKGAGSLYCLYPDFSIRKKLDGITISNGLAWNREADTFFHIDTPEGTITSFHYEKKTGNISHKKILFKMDAKDGYPDGMTMDTEDKLWVAIYNGGKVIRINPINGEIETEVLLPVPKPTSCAFGGENLNELYITTCREHMTDGEIKNSPLSGSLFRAELPFTGLAGFRFAG